MARLSTGKGCFHSDETGLQSVELATWADAAAWDSGAASLDGRAGTGMWDSVQISSSSRLFTSIIFLIISALRPSKRSTSSLACAHEQASVERAPLCEPAVKTCTCHEKQITLHLDESAGMDAHRTIQHCLKLSAVDIIVSGVQHIPKTLQGAQQSCRLLSPLSLSPHRMMQFWLLMKTFTPAC